MLDGISVASTDRRAGGGRISTWRWSGGEIVCIAGVQGNGQTELAEALLGVTPDQSRAR